MSVLCAGLNFDSIIGVWYMWIVSVTGIGRRSKLCISYAAVRTPLFVILDQFVLVQFLAVAYEPKNARESALPDSME